MLGSDGVSIWKHSFVDNAEIRTSYNDTEVIQVKGASSAYTDFPLNG